MILIAILALLLSGGAIAGIRTCRCACVATGVLVAPCVGLSGSILYIYPKPYAAFEAKVQECLALVFKVGLEGRCDKHHEGQEFELLR